MFLFLPNFELEHWSNNNFKITLQHNKNGFYTNKGNVSISLKMKTTIFICCLHLFFIRKFCEKCFGSK